MAYKSDAAAARRPNPLRRLLLLDTRGVTALEFAFVAIPLLLFVIGSIVSGINLVALGILDIATKEAGRQIQIGTIRNTSDEPVFTLICDRMKKVMPKCDRNVLMIYAASGPTFGVVQVATVTRTTLSPTTFSPGIAGSAVVLQVAYKSPLGLSMANIESFMLTSTTAFRNEP